jgi:hypothetical protein
MSEPAVAPQRGAKMKAKNQDAIDINSRTNPLEKPQKNPNVKSPTANQSIFVNE